jgi:hypothetical protein
MTDIIAQLREAGIDTDDLDRRLTKARSAATAVMRISADPVSTEPTATPKLRDAATRGYFLPSDLGFPSDTEASGNTELRDLLAQCEVVPVRGRQVWQLKSAVRRQVLSQASASNTLKPVIDKPMDEGDPEGSMLRRVLNGFSPLLENVTASELDQLVTISDWLAGTGLAKLPRVEEIRRQIAKRELIEPFRTLIGRSLQDGSDGSEDRIVGRAKETEQLRAYVGIMPPEQLRDLASRTLRSLWHTITSSDAANEPLIIDGIGGMGKSSLIAKFILDHALFPGINLPFAYLDFDRAALAPREPLQLLIDITIQFSIWFPELETRLAELRTDLRNSIDLLASHPSERSREDTTRSRLNSCCFELKSVVESINDGQAPVLLVFDTFEVVQYDDNAVKGVVDLISALRTPVSSKSGQTAEQWSNLRIVVAGRAAAPEIKTSQTPILLGPLPLSATEELIRRRNAIDALDLTKPQITALAKPLRGSPLDVTIVMNWLKSREPSERVALVDEIIDEIKEAKSTVEETDNADPDSLAGRRITGILINRMVKHINDKEVQKLVIPGLVVRAVTPEVIRYVMAPASRLVESPDALAKGAEDELFRRLEHERWLVTRSGNYIRHRSEIRLAMLDLMRRQDRQRFDAANCLALDYFSGHASDNADMRAEAIYHLLLGGDTNIREAERLWTQAVSVPLSSAVDDLTGLAQVYLKAKLGRSVPIEALRMLPTSASFSVLLSFGKRFLQRGLSGGLTGIIDEVQKVERNPALLGLYWESLYRSGRWRDLRDASNAEAKTGRLARIIAALNQNDFDSARAADEAVGSPLRFCLRLATRDPQMADDIFATDISISQIDFTRSSKFGEAFWDFAAFMAHASWRTPNFSNMEGRAQLIDSIGEMSGLDRKLPAAATTSGALRILAFYEQDSLRRILRRLDFEGLFSTVSGRELQEFKESFGTVAGELLDQRSGQDAVARGERLLQALSEYPVNSVVADVSLTKEFAWVVRAMVESGSRNGATGALRMLAITHPDWLEPAGHALTRAFRGKVPSKLGWWSSVESYFGSTGRRSRSKQLSDGHAILSLADEAGSLPEAMSAYVEILDVKDAEARDFIEISNAFEKWRRSLGAALVGV